MTTAEVTMPSKTPQLRKITQQLKAQRRPCHLCGQPINYHLPTDHPDAFTIDHKHPRSTHPHLENDPTNCLPAHARCNKARGNTPIATSTWTHTTF